MCWIQRTLVFEVGLTYDLADFGERERQGVGWLAEGEGEIGEGMEEAGGGGGWGQGFLVIQGKAQATGPSLCRKAHLFAPHPFLPDPFVAQHLEHLQALCL